MIHVPDVRATVAWYEDIGFTVVETYGDGGPGLSFAVMAFGGSQVMFNTGGQPTTAARREVDLYLYTEDVDALHARLASLADVVEGPHDTFYGMREVIVRDLNGFWVTFGEPSTGVGRAEMPAMLEQAGAVAPPHIEPESPTGLTFAQGGMQRALRRVDDGEGARGHDGYPKRSRE